MLREIPDVRQIPGEPRRRWFNDEAMDLYVWLDDSNECVGFQLTYGKPRAEKAFTWKAGDRYSHLGVDDGARPGRHPGSPILVPDGVFDAAGVLPEFRERAGHMDAEVADFVAAKIEALCEIPVPAVRPDSGRWLRYVVAAIVLGAAILVLSLWI